MKPITKSFLMLMAIFAVGSSLAFAQQSISGKVTDINQEGNSLTLKPHAESAAEISSDSVEVFLKPDAKLKGLHSLDNLSVGDEVKIDATQEQAWFAKSIEATDIKKEDVDAKEGARPGFFSRAMGQIQSAWYKFRYDIRINPDIYEKYAQERLETDEKRIQNLKTTQPKLVDPDSSPEKMILKAEQDLAEAREDFKQLQAMDPYAPEFSETVAEKEPMEEARKESRLSDPWREAKAELDRSLNDLRDSVFNAAKETLSEKDLYVWESENEVQEMKYDIEELKTAHQQIQADQNVQAKDPQNEQNFQNLKNQLQKTEAELNKVRTASGEDWRNLRKDVDQSFRSFRASYYDAVAQIGKV